MGLDPWTPGSRPGPKAGAKPLSHPEIPAFLALMIFLPDMVDGQQKNFFELLHFYKFGNFGDSIKFVAMSVDKCY